MIITCEECRASFTDAMIQVPNRCPSCGRTIMSEAELTIIVFIKNNYPAFEYVPMLSTLKAEGIQKQLVVKCLKCTEVLRMTGIGGMDVGTYCGGMIRQVLDRHIIKCEATQVVAAVEAKRKPNKFVELPQREIDLEEY